MSAPTIAYEAGAYVVKTAPVVVGIRKVSLGIEIVTLKIGHMYYVARVFVAESGDRFPMAWNERPTKASAATAADDLAAL